MTNKKFKLLCKRQADTVKTLRTTIHRMEIVLERQNLMYSRFICFQAVGMESPGSVFFKQLRFSF